MSNFPPFSPRQQSPVPVVIAGAAFLLATWLVLDRAGVFQRGPMVDPRPVTPRGDLMEIEKTTTSIFEKYAPSVVHITTTLTAPTIFGGMRKIEEGTGTGFLWDTSGTVVTNYHVVANVVENHQEDHLKVALGDDLYAGAIVGTSQQYDIAVLRIIAPPSNLVAIPLGSSSELKVGQTVLAIGNPYGFDRSLSTGIISALNRNIATENAKMSGLIQTDAAINPGNSGGPLLDSAGLLIGMNTAIYSPNGSNAGIGFAVPVDTINDIVPGLLDGKAAQRTLGVFPWKYAVPLPARLQREGYGLGVPVVGLESGAGAEAAGIKPFQLDGENIIEWGDTIVAINGNAVQSPVDLSRYLRGHKRGEQVKVTLVRGDFRKGLVTDVPVSVK